MGRASRRSQLVTGTGRAKPGALETIVERQEAQLKAAWTSTKAERAMGEVHAAHVCVLELEIARLKRELRRTKK